MEIFWHALLSKKITKTLCTIWQHLCKSLKHNNGVYCYGYISNTSTAGFKIIYNSEEWDDVV